MESFVKKITQSEKTKQLEVAADFGSEEVLFHPLPKLCQPYYKAGQKVTGHFGRKHSTGKFDCRKVPISIQYFIPEGNW